MRSSVREKREEREAVEYVRVVLCVRYVGWGVCVCSEVVVVNHLFIHKMRSQLFSHSSMLRSPLSAPRVPAYLLSPPPLLAQRTTTDGSTARRGGRGSGARCGGACSSNGSQSRASTRRVASWRFTRKGTSKCITKWGEISGVNSLPSLFFMLGLYMPRWQVVAGVSGEC